MASKAKEFAQALHRPQFSGPGVKAKVNDDGSPYINLEPAVKLDTETALDLARWILDTFGEPSA